MEAPPALENLFIITGTPVPRTIQTFVQSQVAPHTTPVHEPPPVYVTVELKVAVVPEIVYL